MSDVIITLVGGMAQVGRKSVIGWRTFTYLCLIYGRQIDRWPLCE